MNISRTFIRVGERKFREKRAFSGLWIPLPFLSRTRNLPDHQLGRFSPAQVTRTNKRFYSPHHIPQPFCENIHVAPHVRTCLSGDPAQDHSGFHVWFLGTGGTHPSQARMTSATLLHLGRQSFLFDVGEGTQRQLIYARHGITIKKIFITHMHADHVLGLFGVLLTIQQVGRSRGEVYELDVYGPPGIYNFIAANLALTRSFTGDVQITVHELVGGDADAALKRNLQQTRIIHGHFPHMFNSRGLVRNAIERNDDGTWTIQEATFSNDSAFDVDRGSNRPMIITAAEVKHVNNVQTFGYVVQEPEPSQKIDPAKAKELGVEPSIKYRKLKNGYAVRSDDGLREVKPEQVLIGSNRKSRKIAVIGDNCGMSHALADLCRNADVMVHEAVSSIHSKEVAIERGHSSPEMAGEAARKVNANVLALNHISAGVAAHDVKDLVIRAEETNGGTSHIVPTFDFMELVVPRFGFDGVSS